MEGVSDRPMNQVPKKHLLSLKSLLVMCLALALFTLANSVDRSPETGGICRGVPLTYFWEGHTKSRVTHPETHPLFGVWIVHPDIETVHMPVNLVIDVTVALVLSALLALACERLVFRRFRAARSVEWRSTGER